MKSISRMLLPGILLNPISRNLILIFVGGLLAAVTLVTAVIIALG